MIILTKEKIILGIDPGTNILGYGIIRVDSKGPHYVDMGVFDLRKIKDPFEKLANIFAGVSELIATHSPDELAVESPFYGKNYQLYATENYLDADGKIVVHAGDILCSDTIRSWYPTPLYQLYILDTPNENSLGANQFQGASGKGANGDMYLFRLADTYLLRAEAKFYQGNASGAAEDVNAVRRRANAKKMYSTVTIGDIMDERARELYLEEFRQAEMVRVSWCLAKSGKPDEWGETYDINTWDKQEGTDLNGGSYWFKRCTRYNVFNQPYGKGAQGNQQFEYKVNKHNLHWPIPNSAITANINGVLRQNYGYDGYDASVAMWTNWEDAVADEDKI